MLNVAQHQTTVSIQDSQKGFVLFTAGVTQGHLTGQDMPDIFVSKVPLSPLGPILPSFLTLLPGFYQFLL